MIFSPYFWLILALICASCYVGGCAQGHHAVQKEWDVEKAEQQARQKQTEAENVAAASKALARQSEREAAAAKDFAVVAADRDKLRTRLSAITLDRDLTYSLLRSTQAANGQAVAAGQIQDSPTAPAITGEQTADWYDRVAKLYRACRDQVVGMQAWYEDLKW